MQKLRFVNGNGVEIDLTGGNYGITAISGLSNANLNLQTQQVPNNDGSVYIDSLLDNRTIDMTVALYDGNDLEKRYQLRRELISALNPKLGKGYLYYKNDFLERRIKVIPNPPVIKNKNSNEKGTVKASVSFTACGVYWEDVEETTVAINSYEQKVIKNNGDIPCSIQLEGINTNMPFRLFNNTSGKKIVTKEDIALSLRLNTGLGEKSFGKGGFGKVFENGVINGTRSITFNPITNQYVILTDNGIWVSDDEETWYLKNGDYSNIGFVFYDEDNNYYIIGIGSNIYTTDDLINLTQVATVSGSCFRIWKIDGMYIVSSISNTYYGTDLANLSTLYAGSYTAFEKNGSIYVIGTIHTNIYSSGSWTSTSHGKIVTDACNNGDYVVIQAADGLYYSNNYLSWTQITSDTTAKNPIYSSLLEKWIYTDSSTLHTSSDLSIWETQSIDWGGTPLLFIETRENKDLMFIQASSSVDQDLKQIKTTDLINFSVSDIGHYFSGSAVSYLTKDKDSLYLVIGGAVNGKCFIYKKTTSWELVTTLENVYLSKFKYISDTNRFIILGFNTVYISDDLENWDSYSFSAYDVIYTNGQYTFVGYNGTITITTDFADIQTYNFLTTDSLYNIDYCNGYYYITCANGIAYSSDAINWTWLYQTSMGANVNKTCVHDDKLYITNNTQVIIVDGLNYTIISFAQNQNYSRIFYLDIYNCFILVGNSESYITTDFQSAFTLPFAFSTLEEFENEIYIASNILCFSLEIDTENAISELTTDSNMTLGLEVGENKLTITGQINGVYYLTYRQKYLGV